MKKYRYYFCIAYAFLTGFASEIVMSEGEIVLKIAVQSSGQVVLNGAPINLDELRMPLENAAQNNGVVWYYRENPDAEEPPSSAIDVLQLVVEYNLPISLSTKPDFSDYVDQNGKSHPR